MEPVDSEAPPPVGHTLVTRRGRLNAERIMSALKQCNGHRASAARMLGVSERTLYRHMQKLREQIIL